MDELFNNIGKKLMIVAKIVGWLTVCGIFLKGVSLAQYNAAYFLLMLFCPIGFIPAWILYAYAQKVEDTNAIRKMMQRKEPPEEPVAKPKAAPIINVPDNAGMPDFLRNA